MKILLLSDANNPHTVKWARSLADNGLDISIFSLAICDERIYKGHPGIAVYSMGIEASVVKAPARNLSKLGYLKALPRLRELIERLRPDIVHAHFATSYGLLGALSGFHPYILSVWGSDIYDFPGKSFVHEGLLRFNLARADRILSTSHVMAGETRRYTRKPVEVTPFGVDLDIFKSSEVKSPFDLDEIVIGTVKSLEPNYGIRYLVEAFRILKDRHVDLPLKLLIVGGGSLEAHLKELARALDIEKDTVFIGRVSCDDVPLYHNMLTVFVAVSVSESFGVAVIEAGACERPVVVSDVGGLPEIVEDGVTGFIVRPMDPGHTADAIEKLILDEGLRVRMGKAGRARVRELFDWKFNVAQMMGIYRDTLKTTGVDVEKLR